MKSNRQARHILGLDYRISNQRKVVTEGDTSSVVNNPTGRKRRADSQKLSYSPEMTLNTIASAMVFLFIGMTLTSHNALYSGSVPWWKAIYDDKRRCQGQLFEKE